MPCDRREREVEQVIGWWLPGLEVTFDHIDLLEVGQVCAGGGGQVRTDLYAGDPIAPARQWERGLARGAAHLEQPAAWLESGHLDQGVEELRRVLGSSLLIQVGHRVERPSQLLRSVQATFNALCEVAAEIRLGVDAGLSLEPREVRSHGRP
jgi:hypothetical protein